MQKLLVASLILSTTIFSCNKSTTLFKYLGADDTGITFSNRIVSNDTINVLDFEYIYNGGGVAVGDFNADGLQDVYFTGNQVDNKLYLNISDTVNHEIKFKDITQTSKTSAQGKWCSGVAVADVNADGKLDIYVCANVKKAAKDRENLLYINQGNDRSGVPIFAEKAKEYGLADTTYSTNAAFFDYDNDGDLDVYVLVDKVDKTKTPSNFREKRLDGKAPNNDQLYRNDFDSTLGHAVFTNITAQAGIIIEGFGLGLNITDINRDGWKDIYVTNDFLANDLMWINNKKGGFVDQASTYFKHTSSSAMGNDIADINNDGLADVVALDMLPEDNYRKKMLMNPNNYITYQNNERYGFQHQYVRNTLQLNQGVAPLALGGQPAFSEISLMAGIAETDWSWCPLLADFDNDGYRDLIVTNGFPKDVTDHDFIQFRNESGQVAGWEYMLEQIPEIKIQNYAFKNKGNAKFEKVTELWGMNQPSFSNGAIYADLDLDGDLDYIVNNINDSAFVYQNRLVQNKVKDSNYLRVKFVGDSLNTQGLGAILEAKLSNGETFFYEHSPYRGYLSTVEAIAHIGLGAATQIDHLKITWQNGKKQVLTQVKANQIITVFEKNSKVLEEPMIKKEAPYFTPANALFSLNYTHNELDYIDFNIQKLLPHKFSQYGPSLAVADINGDGLDDFFVGGSSYRQGKMFVQTKESKFKPTPWTTAADTTKTEEDAGALFIDADSDGDQDLYLVSGSNEQPAGSPYYQDRLFVNDGKGNFTQSVDALPKFQKSGSCVKAADIDHDGDLDLFVGGRVVAQQYPKPAPSFVLRNDSQKGKPKFIDITKAFAPQLVDMGLVCDGLWTDFNNDGWPDLALVGEWMPVKFLKNNAGKNLIVEENPILDAKKGWWNSITGADIDNDGDTDYVVGNLGENSIAKATDNEPIRVYGKDFNDDKQYDAIPTAYFPDELWTKKEYPYHTREDMIRQLINTRTKYPDFASYAKAKFSDIFKPEELNGALLLEANYMKSSIIENLGNGKFAIKPLPYMAQSAPMFGIQIIDINNDGWLDIVAVGNDFGAELTNGRYDASNGWVLFNQQNNEFQPTQLATTGFFVPGNAKALARLRLANNNTLLLASQNQGSLLSFLVENTTAVSALPNETKAIIKLKNGKTRSQELYYGDSFYTASSRSLAIGADVQQIEFLDNNNKKRNVKL